MSNNKNMSVKGNIAIDHHLWASYHKLETPGLPVVSSGQVDAIVSWFDLCLDDTNRLSSSPHSSSCWEQAVFPVTLSSSFEPEENGQEYLSVSKRDSITVAVSCYDDCLHLKCTKISHHDSSKMESTPSPMPDTTHEEIMEKMVTSFKENVSTGQDESRNSEHQEKVCEDVGVTVSSMGGAVSSIDSYSHPCHSCDMLRPDTLAIMNDNKVNTAYYNAIKTIITGNRLPVRHDTTSDSLNYSSPRKSQNSISEGTSSPPTDKPSNYVCESVSPMFGVLDISVGVPLTGLFAAKHLNAARVCIPTTESVTRTLIETVARTNGIEDCVAFEVEPHPLSPSSETVWDVLVTDLVAPCGTLRERVLEDIAVGRVCALKPTGVVIPGTLSVFAMCIQCASLWTDSEVVGNESTMGLKIAEFINQYKVSTFLDIHLSTRVYKQLSKPFLLFHLNFNEKQMANSSDLPSFVNQSTVQQFEATEDGMITAIPFWYNIGVDVSNHVNTLDNETHWKQAAYLLAEGLDVRKGDQVKVTARIEDSSFLFEVEVG